MQHALRTVALVAFLTSSSAALQSSADYGDAAYFGTSLAGLGDLDGDGLPELAVGQARPGVVWILSGATERVHLRLEVPREEDEQASYMPFSQVLAGAGDVDSDGAEDLAVGVPVSSGGAFGHVYVFSGRTGDVLHHLRGPVADDNFGSSLASAGDVNGDGVPDLVVGAPAWRSEGEGSAHVFSGSDGERLFSVEGARIGDRFGESVTGGRDVDGDGCPDFAVGAPQPEPPYEHPGYVDVFSGRSGERLLHVRGRWGAELADRDRNFGSAVLLVPDVNRDGQPDIAVGVTMDSLGRLPYLGIFSGADGSLLREITAKAESSFGSQLALTTAEVGPAAFGFGDRARTAADWNLPWIVVAAPTETNRRGGLAGAVYVHAARNGRRMSRVLDTEDQKDFSRGWGQRSTALEDVDGDGLPDFAASRIGVWSLGLYPGVVRVYSAHNGALIRSISIEEVQESNHYAPVIATPLQLGLFAATLVRSNNAFVPRGDEVRELPSFDASPYSFPGYWQIGNVVPGSYLVNGGRGTVATLDVVATEESDPGGLALLHLTAERGVVRRRPLGIDVHWGDWIALLPIDDAGPDTDPAFVVLLDRASAVLPGAGERGFVEAHLVEGDRVSALGAVKPWPASHAHAHITSVRPWSAAEHERAPRDVRGREGFVVSGISSQQNLWSDSALETARWSASLTLTRSTDAAESPGGWTPYPGVLPDTLGICGTPVIDALGTLVTTELRLSSGRSTPLELLFQGGRRPVPAAVIDTVVELEREHGSNRTRSVQAVASPRGPDGDLFLVSGRGGHRTLVLDARGELIAEFNGAGVEGVRSAWCLDAERRTFGVLAAPDYFARVRRVVLVTGTGSEIVELPHVGGETEDGLGEGIVLLPGDAPGRFTLVLGGLLDWGSFLSKGVRRGAVQFVELQWSEEPEEHASGTPGPGKHWSVISTATVWID